MTRRVLIVLAVVAVLALGGWALATGWQPVPADPDATGPTGIPGGATAATGVFLPQLEAATTANSSSVDVRIQVDIGM